MVLFDEKCSLLSLGLWCQDETLQNNNQSFEDVDVVDPLHANFHTGLAASVCVTVMSELGDKTFLLSAILAMHRSRTLTFLGSMLGQTIMTVVAVTLGMAASLVPEIYTKWASCICMTLFGLKMLREGFSMTIEGEDNKCLDDNFKDLDKKITDKLLSKSEKKEEPLNDTSDQKLQEHNISTADNKSSRRNSGQGVLVQAFTLTFLGEWGDRSQIATIVLASNENPYGVAAGSLLGHAICSLLAVVGGRLLAQKFPVKTMTQAGGVVFLLFAASTIIFE